MAYFIDTNVVIYAFEAGNKADRALALLRDATISVQVLNAFANVAIRKMRYNADELEMAIDDIRIAASQICPIDEDIHDHAREITFRYKLGFYDSLLIATALLSGCDTFFSEDMHDGLVIEDQLTIRNPFA